MILMISPKDVYFTKRFVEEAEKSTIELETMTVQELADRAFDVDVNRYDCLYIRFCYPYFLETVALAKKFAVSGKRVVDGSIAQGAGDINKFKDYQALTTAGLPMPGTRQLSDVKTWQYPAIAKWNFGFGGKEVFLIKNADDLHRATQLIDPEELLLQEFVPAEAEYKIITVGYKALPLILKFKTDPKIFRLDFGKTEALTLDVHPGIFQGSEKYPGSSNGLVSGSRLSDALGRDGADKLIFIAEQSSRLLKRELAKVDVLESKGKFYILEVNRCPGMKSFEELTKYNAIGKFLEYLRNQAD